MSKKILILISVVLAALTFTSCAPLEDEEDGVFVIKNQSEYDDVITDIWIWDPQTESLFHTYSQCNIQKGASFVISNLKQGKKYTFEVEIDAENNDTTTHVTFDLGYNNFRKLEAGDTINIIFDGDGLYFEDMSRRLK